MKRTFFSLFLIFLASGCISTPNGVFVISSPIKESLPEPTQIPELKPQCCVTLPPPTPTPQEKSYAEIVRDDILDLTGYKPTLRPYEIDKSIPFWHAKDPSSYIIPDNPWVQYYALTGQTPQIFYKSDQELYPSNQDKDVWQNADYTLYSWYGDCEDLSIVYVSILRARGEKAIVVSGYLEENNGNRIRDTWFEYYDVTLQKTITHITSGSATTIEYKTIPLYMFNDKITWREYDPNWYSP